MKNIEPLITEKTLNLASHNWFTFAVDKKATKPQIAKLVEKNFKVHVVDVKTLSIKGKTYRAGRKGGYQTRPDGKKALIKLKNGEKIDLFTVEQPPPVKTEKPKK